MFLITFAVILLVALFLIKTSQSNNWFKEIYQKNNTENGLTYENMTVQDLVNQDTDGDGVLNWQEGLYGLDPTKKETTPGIPDSSVLNKSSAQDNPAVGTKETTPTTEKLTQTEQFSRELFATVAAASQNGVMDQTMIDQLSASLAEKIQNPPQRKVFSSFEIKIINDDSVKAFMTYNNALNSIYEKYPPMDYTIMDVLQKFTADENNIDTSALVKLKPIIEQTNKVIEGMVKTSVPQSLSTLHLNVINSLKGLEENLSDIMLYANDPIVALGGISKYEKSATKLESDINNLGNAISQRFKQP